MSSKRPADARRGFSPWRDLPVTIWLTALVAVVPLQAWIPEPRWLVIHLLLLGAVTHSVVVWSQHFTDALLHRPADAVDGRRQARLLALLNLGALAVMVGTQADAWAVTVAGATGVAVAVTWHGARLARRLHVAVPVRFRGQVRYYVTASAMLPVGATLGVLLARDPADPWHARLLLAHVTVNLLGWVGLTVAGTLLTLWPAILRTRLDAATDRVLTWALPVLAAGVLGSALGDLLGAAPVAAAGLIGFAGGLGLVAVPLARTAARKPPASFPAWSVTAGLLWWVALVVVWAVRVATAPTELAALSRFEALVPYLVAGFAAQVLLGALGYLIPMALRGGPRAVRAGNAVVARGGAARVAAANAGLLVLCLPVPGPARSVASAVVLVALAATVPLLLAAVRASRRAAKAVVTGGPAGRPQPPSTGSTLRETGAGLVAVAVAVAVGLGVDAASGSGGGAAAVVPTGHTTTVAVRAENMRFVPGTIRVPAGDRLVLEVSNRDDQVHDLVLDGGRQTGRLAPGQHARLDVGVVGHDLAGWCSVVGHRRMGMTLRVQAVGGTSLTRAPSAAASAGGLDPVRAPAAGFTARNAALPPLTGERVHNVTLRVGSAVRAVAPGVRARVPTVNGTFPGPVLHGRVGDRFVITVVNDAARPIDLDAGALTPDGPVRPLAPGASAVYRFTAREPGVSVYRGSGAGGFGAVVIEPPGLPGAGQSFVLVQSELGVDRGVAFNGYAWQYDHDPLRVRTGERVRLWLLDAGPGDGTSFHVVGSRFDTVFADGGYRLRPGNAEHGAAQSVDLDPGQGGFVEFVLREPGHYPFVDHAMVDAEHGAHGVIVARG